ncbi:MAG: hypothetical protein AB7O73_02390 [Bacteroidia bacterium]
MNNEYEKYLSEKLSLDNFKEVENTPRLNKNSIKLVQLKRRKVERFEFIGIISFLFGNFRTGLTTIVILVSLALLTQTEITHNNRVGSSQPTKNPEYSTFATISNTYMASLKPSEYSHVNTTSTRTNVTCISTFIGKN